MEDLINNIRTAMFEEHERMCAKYGDTYHTSHEAYAVTMEEYEEARDELNIINASLKGLWSLIKEDCSIADQVEGIMAHALRAAAECVQVAACCHKALQSDCCRENHDE